LIVRLPYHVHMDDMRVEFLYTLYFIGRKVKGHYRKKNADIMLTATILHILGKEEQTLSKLSEKVYSKISSLSEKVSEMETDGLVKKMHTGDDERETTILITEKGKKYSAMIFEKMRTHCLEFTKHMSEKDVVDATNLMQKLLI